MRQSQTEENYLKAIYTLTKSQPNAISTKSIGELLEIKSPTVSDMLKKLAAKNLIEYTRYKGVSLTKEGEVIALKVIRKHRLWETFLVEKFNFKWDEVHDVAEQLEHIDSHKLVEQLDAYLGFPRFDPHGDPIPNEHGVVFIHHDRTLDQVGEGEKVILVGVKDHTKLFLKYLESNQLTLGAEISVLQVIEYDRSLMVRLQKKFERSLSFQVCKNLYIK